MRKLVPKHKHHPESASLRTGHLAMGLILVASLATSACGFKLRGQVEIPAELNPMFIQPQQGSQVRGALIEQLQGSQVRLAARPQDARVIVRITDESWSSRVAAVDRNGKVLASELHYGLTFDAVAPDGKQLVTQQTINVVRTYENPDVEVLGKQLEAELIRAEMLSDAANRILDRLRAVLL